MISNVIGSVIVLLPRDTGSRTSASSHVDVTVGDAPEHHVRFTSGGIFYAEGMVEDRWAARYWSGDGRIPFPYRFFGF